jgi:hypothetical protein
MSTGLQVISDSRNLLNFGVFRGLVLSSVLVKLCKLGRLILPLEIYEFDNLRNKNFVSQVCR